MLVVVASTRINNAYDRYQTICFEKKNVMDKIVQQQRMKNKENSKKGSWHLNLKRNSYSEQSWDDRALQIYDFNWRVVESFS